MNAGEISRLRDELEQLRRRSANVKRGELESLAFRLGWEFKGKTGKEPRYQKPHRYPLAIPNHRELKRFTVESILDTLEEDLDREEAALDERRRD